MEKQNTHIVTGIIKKDKGNVVFVGEDFKGTYKNCTAEGNFES